jgi:hypothetical protein
MQISRNLLVRLLAAPAMAVGFSVLSLGTTRAEPITLSIIDTGGDLASTEVIIRNYVKANPDKVKDIKIQRAPAPELPAKIKAQQDAGRLDINLVLTGQDGGSLLALNKQIIQIPNYKTEFPREILTDAGKALYDEGGGYLIPSVGIAGGPVFIYNVGNNLMTASGFAFNQGVNIGVTPLAAGMQSTVGISLGAVSPAIPLLNGGGSNTPTTAGPARWVMCAVSATGACASPLTDPPTTGGAFLPATFTISRTGAAAVPTNVSITAVAEGATGVFNNPFSSVQFYAYDPTAGLGTEGWRLIGTLTSANSTSDLLGAGAPNGRNWYFTINWTPNLVTAPDNAVYRVMAIGIANGTHTGPPSQVGAAVATPLAFSTVTITP